MPGTHPPLGVIKRALLEPANNLHVCGIIAVASAFLLLITALLVGSKGVFLLVAIPTVLAALVLIYAAAGAEPRAARPTDSFKPNTLAVLLYCAGIIGSAGGYAYLALTRSSVVAPHDEVIAWDLFDKRPLVFGYLVVVAFIAFHWFVVGFFVAPPTPRAEVRKTSVQWAHKILGGVLTVFLAYCWIALPALHAVSTGLRHRPPDDGRGLADFYDLHEHVHLSALEQIRLGAMPYFEAETQYGLGNQVLMYFLTNFVNFSNHGFFAANILLNAVCVIGFFVLLQQFLGLGWAVLGLIGWVLLPSPYAIIDFAGWTLLTRWLAIPVLSLLLASLLLSAPPGKRMGLAPLLAGVLWGTGGFLSQENFSGGFLVLVFSLALFGPASGRPLRGLAGFAALFGAGGVAAFVMWVTSFVGISHCLDVLRLANTKAGLVMAGVSNSLWSDDLGLSAAFKAVNGRVQTLFGVAGELRPLFQTYGFAILLMVAVALLAGFLGRQWYATAGKEREFVRKFAGVAVGAYVLHLFTLLRSDYSHLSGPSLLLPLFLVMLPVFAWRCVRPGMMRAALLVVSVGAIFDAAIAGRSEIGRRMDGIATAWSDSAEVLQTYGELRRLKRETPDLAARYSPIEKFQAAFRNHRDFGEARELFGLLRDRLRGRPVELGFHKLNELIDHPEAFYFFGGFRSVSGITSPTNSIWLRSEEKAWIDKVVNAHAACVFFEPNADSRLFEAWGKSLGPSGKIVSEPIVGQRPYGILSCKT